MFQKILYGFVWGLIWTAVVTLVVFLVIPFFSFWVFAALGVVSVTFITVGVVKGVRSKEVVCSNCKIKYRVMSKKDRCPQCGLKN